MALRDYLPSFLRREQDTSAALLGELTPAERRRLDSTEKDPIEYWERVSDKTLLSSDILKSASEDRQIANGWTEREAKTMFEHISTKYANEPGVARNASSDSVRRAERMADATDPMHDARREQQADTYRARQAARDAARARAAPSVHSDADRARAVAQTRVASPVSTL